MAKASLDPNYTAEISAKMQVPERIRAHQSDGRRDDASQRSQRAMAERGTDKAAAMHVPDRIMVAGRAQHISSDDDPLQDKKYDFVPPEQGLLLRTPPRTLRLEDSGGGGDVGSSTDQPSGAPCVSTSTGGGAEDRDGTSPLVPPSAVSLAAAAAAEEKRLWNANRKYNGSLVRHYADDMDLLPSEGPGGGGLPVEVGDKSMVGLREDAVRVQRQLERLHQRVTLLEHQVDDQRTRETVAVLALVGYLAMRFISWVRRY